MILLMIHLLSLRINIKNLYILQTLREWFQVPYLYIKKVSFLIVHIDKNIKKSYININMIKKLP